MPAIGITGGISTGKSTFCECLREVLQGAKFFNADGQHSGQHRGQSLLSTLPSKLET